MAAGGLVTGTRRVTAGVYVVGFLTLVAAGVVFGWLENPLWRALAVLVGTWLGLSVMARKARRPAGATPPASPVLPLADRGPDGAMGTAPDPSTIVNGDPAGQGEGLPQRTCEVCDTIDLTDTTARLVDRVNSGRMRYLRGDVPLEDMYDLFLSDMKYTIVSYLECLECGRTRFWGLCIRGAAVYAVVDPDEPDRWPWEPVPPRALWKREHP